MEKLRRYTDRNENRRKFQGTVAGATASEEIKGFYH
jgi:hypothetical protein